MAGQVPPPPAESSTECNPWEVDWLDALDISPEADGSVLKLVISPGEVHALGGVPVHGCRCDVHVTGWLADSHVMFMTTRRDSPPAFAVHSRDKWRGSLVGGADEPLSVHLHEDSQLPPCLHTACASMSLGEVAWLYTSPEQGYGTGGDGGRVPPHAALYWHLQLVGFSAPQPPLPDPAQVKAQAAEAEAAEAEAWARNPPPSWDSRLASAAACRAEGNALFKAGAWAEAGKAYGRGMVHLFLSTDEAKFGGVVESTLREVSRAKALLHLNRSAACLRQGKCTEAEWDANEAVKHCAVSVGALHATREAAEAAAARGGGAGTDPLWDTARKALYRRGCARLAAVRRGLDTALRTLDLPGALDRVRAAKVDMEAAVGVRDFGVVEGPGDRGGASLAPPPCGVDRLVFTPRHPGRSVPQGSVAEALERAQATEVRVHVAMEEEARATASLFRGIFRAPDPRPAEAAAEEEGGGDSDSSEGVPELGD